jgi:putative nucleotidyltransferase with HDIG domain
MQQPRQTEVRDLAGAFAARSLAIAPPSGISSLQAGFTGRRQYDGWLARVKRRLFQHFEAVLVLVLLGSLLFIDLFIVNKYAFLLFYFIPVLLAGFYLGKKQAVLTAILATGFVVYMTLMLGSHTATLGGESNFWNLMIWSSFLTLTGAIVGQLQEKNQAQLAQLQDAYLGIIAILTKYLESADAYTKSHSERVAAISTELAKRIGLLPDEVHNVWIAALLHDIGKVEVIELIQRAASLDPTEKAQVDNHTQLGAQLLLTAGAVLQDAIPIVLDHHRRYDDGGESIPIGARILAVADAYDAIVSDRPYRAGRHHWQAVEILKEGAGTQFDPRAVAALEGAKEQVLTVYEAA